LEKPTARATSVTVRLVSESRLLARSTRRWMTYWCGESPVAVLNERAKWTGLMCSSPAISGSVSFLGRLSFM
jgi:hypothetical protein